MIKRTSDYWHLWANKESPSLEFLPEKIRETYKRSLLILRIQIDWNGGILASNDSYLIHYNRDTYSYIWARNGALVVNALDMAGYPVMARYEGDEYQRLSDDVPGNSWFIGTLWLVNYMIQNARTEEDLKKVLETFSWGQGMHYLRGL